jgi:hypothetical protein
MVAMTKIANRTSQRESVSQVSICHSSANICLIRADRNIFPAVFPGAHHPVVVRVNHSGSNYRADSTLREARGRHKSMETATGRAFPPNIGKIIGTLDADGNLVLVEDRSTETPVDARSGTCDSRLRNRPSKASLSRRISRFPLHPAWLPLRH